MEHEAERKHIIRVQKKELAPLLDQLRQAGYEIHSLDELRRSGKSYRSAVPILVNWLSQVKSAHAKESIVRTLSVPWAKPVAGPILIDEFENAPKEAEGLRWSIGNALEVVAEPTLLERLTRIVTNKENGKSREMFVVALAKIPDPRTTSVLIKLLDDNQVAGHAIMALRKLRAPEALDYLEKFTKHSQSWIRNEARKAIASIMKAHPPNLGI
jgi:hypothetical protein